MMQTKRRLNPALIPLQTRREKKSVEADKLQEQHTYDNFIYPDRCKNSTFFVKID